MYVFLMVSLREMKIIWQCPYLLKVICDNLSSNESSWILSMIERTGWIVVFKAEELLQFSYLPIAEGEVDSYLS